jgi:hypothetical protein
MLAKFVEGMDMDAVTLAGTTTVIVRLVAPKVFVQTQELDIGPRMERKLIAALLIPPQSLGWTAKLL